MFGVECAAVGYWWILPLGLFALCFLVCAFLCLSRMRRGGFSCCPPGCCGREGARGDEGEDAPEPGSSPSRD